MDFVDTLQPGKIPIAILMKIYVNARFLTQPVSGVQRYGIECSRQIKKLHPEAVFLTPKNILHKDIAQELGAKLIGINTGHLWEQADLPFYLTGKKGAPLLSLANTAPLAYSNNYVTIHDLAFYHHPEWNSKQFATWYNILMPRLAYGSRHIFTVSNTVRDELVKAYKLPAAKISVAYNGVSKEMLAYSGHVPKERIILSVGSFSRRKNHQQLVAAFMASELRREYKLVLIGDKNKVFSESGLDEQTLTGNNIAIYQGLGEQELIEMYRKAEIVASLSLYEGFGIPLLEGLYNGCKVVCSGIPVYRELYDGYASFCDPTDVSNIEQALIDATTRNKKDIAPLLELYNYERSAKIILDKISAGK